MLNSRFLYSLLNGLSRRGGKVRGLRLIHLSPSSRVHKSAHPDVEVPEVTITEQVLRDFNQFGTKKALIDGVTGRTLTFDQVKDSIWKIASGMSKKGFKKGDVLMMVSENNIDYPIVFHAALSLGGVVTTCNSHYLAGDIVKQALHSNTSYIYCSQFCAVKIKDVISKVNNIKKVFISGNYAGFVPFSHLLEDDGSYFPTNPVADPYSVAVLPYSSGTTGLPKGVMISHHNEVANSMQIDIPDYLPEKGSDDQLAMLPFYHIYGIFTHCVGLIRKGMTSVVVPGFEPKLFLDCIQNYKIGMIHLVPPILTFLLKHPMISQYDLSSLRRLISGAAPLGLEVIRQVVDKHPYCSVSQGYGLTETSPAISVGQISTSIIGPGSCGRLLPNTYIKVLDADKKEMPKGEKGELCIKGPQVMMGYLNNPEATKQIIDDEGWLHTGDIGYIDSNEFLYVIDRVKELIKYKGFQVPPAELEDILCSHPCVADAAVIGIPDEEAGEVPKAYVALKPEAKISADELDKFINEKVVAFKRLRGGIVFLPQIPRSPAGKILRKDLKHL